MAPAQEFFAKIFYGRGLVGTLGLAYGALHEPTRGTVAGAMAVTMPKTSANHPGVEYVHKDDHRDGTAYKSQWVIPKSDELSVFWDSQTQQWVEGDNAWGLWTLDAAVLKVGEAAAARCPLFVAKFVSEPTGGVALWHGYPADHQRRTSDRPGRSVAHAWLMQGFANLSQAKIAKLLQGKRCVL